MFFFWKVTRLYSLINNKPSSSARKQMLLLCFLNTISRWKTFYKTGKAGEATEHRAKKGVLFHTGVKNERKLVLLSKRTGVNTIMVYLKYRQFRSSTPLVLNRLISIVIYHCNIGTSRGIRWKCKQKRVSGQNIQTPFSLHLKSLKNHTY